MIFDPKERQICAASFAGRVLHHALMNVCHPYFERFLIHDRYATRVGKGTYKAIAKAQHFQKKYRWYAQFDIRKYFYSIDHLILIQKLHRLFKDKQVLEIFEKIIASYETQQGKGIPIGNLTSQYFANMYLGYLDHYIKHTLRFKGYVRYMDDFCIWHDEKTHLKQARIKIETFLAKNLVLQLKKTILN